MRSLRLGQGVREARQSIGGGCRLMRGSLPDTLALGLALGVLPAMVRAALFVGAQGTLLSLWEGWIGALMSNGGATEGLAALVYATLQQVGASGPSSTLFDLAVSLAITPLLLSALSLLYNGFVPKEGGAGIFEAARMAGRNAKSLVLVALCCMLAGWFVKMVPSIASGLLSALAGLLSLIPVLGIAANILALALSVLISLLTDFAVTVIFCYVWIGASCENISGFGALVRSWQLTRNQMHETISALLGLMVIRWLVVAVLCVIWLFIGRTLHIPLEALIFCGYIVGGLYTVALGATTSALYIQRPVARSMHGGFSGSAANLDHLQRANIDE